MSTAQAIELSVETLETSVPSAKSTSLNVEILLQPISKIRAEGLFTEVLYHAEAVDNWQKVCDNSDFWVPVIDTPSALLGCK